MHLCFVAAKHAFFYKKSGMIKKSFTVTLESGNPKATMPIYEIYNKNKSCICIKVDIIGIAKDHTKFSKI